jgi:branched-chain amino acid transport system substrate-binding protein
VSKEVTTDAEHRRRPDAGARSDDGHASRRARPGRVVLSETGPGASLGIPEGRSIRLLPRDLGGTPVEWIVLDDDSDTTRAVTNMRKLITDNRVDAIIGSTVTPASIAMVEVAAEQRVPMISLAGSAAIVSPVDERRRWVFKTAQNDALMATAVADHMAMAGVKNLGIVNVSDSYGAGWMGITRPLLEARGIRVAAEERYARTDTSVTVQVLKVLAGKPDAVFIISAGTPAALPPKTLRERGYRGPMYQTHGVANADFLRVGGKEVEGTILPVAPVTVVDQLPQTILLVEHDMDFVMNLTDRLVVMNFGAELAQGRPKDIQGNPAVIDAYLGTAA